MDLLKYVLKSMNGASRPEVLKKELPFLIHSKAVQESPVVFAAPDNSPCLDLDCSNNWLIASHSGLRASIFRVREPTQSEYSFMGLWELPFQSFRRFYLECVNWNSQNKFFTFSGASQTIHLVDTNTQTQIETISVPEAFEIYQHRPQPQNNKNLAVASNLPVVALIDIRIGNVSQTASGHTASVKSVAWCPSEDNILISCSDSEIFMWDIRITKNPFRIPSVPVTTPVIFPELQIIPGTNCLVLLSSERKLFTWDIGTLKRCCFGTINVKPMPLRYKFATVPFCKPPIIFMPRSNSIDLIDLSTMEVLKELNGHIYPVHTTVFNCLKNELYSSARDGNIVWDAID